MKLALQERLSEFRKYPLVVKNILNYLGDYQKVPLAIFQAAETMLQDNPKGAVVWTYFQRERLNLAKVDITKFDDAFYRLVDKSIDRIVSQIEVHSNKAQTGFESGWYTKTRRQYSHAAVLGKKALDCLKYIPYTHSAVNMLTLKTVSFAYQSANYVFAKQIIHDQLTIKRIDSSTVSNMKVFLDKIILTEKVIDYLGKCAEKAEGGFGSNEVSPNIETISANVNSTNDRVINVINGWINTVSIKEIGKVLEEWDGLYETLLPLVDKLESMYQWQIIAVTKYPLIELRSLFYALDERNFDAETARNIVQKLLLKKNESNINIKEISRRLNKPLKQFVQNLPLMLEERATTLANFQNDDNQLILSQIVDSIAEQLPRSGFKEDQFSEFRTMLSEWDGKYETLATFVDKLSSSQLWPVIAKNRYPLVRLKSLVFFLDDSELDVDTIHYIVQKLLSTGNDINSAKILRKIFDPYRYLLIKLATMLEHRADSFVNSKPTRIRSTLYQIADSILEHLPGGSHQTNPHIAIQDLAWRAVLNDKAGKKQQAYEFARQAINGFDKETESIYKNPYLWNSRIADGYRLIANASRDPFNKNWEKAEKYYEKALPEALPNNKNGLILRIIDMAKNRIFFLFSNKNKGWQEDILDCAERAIKKCQTINDDEKDIVNIRKRLSEASLRNNIALALRKIDPTRALKEEKEIGYLLNAILKEQPGSTGAIWFGWRFWYDRDNLEKAGEWLDAHVSNLRQTVLCEKTNGSYSNLADYIEFINACHFKNNGFLLEARKRFRIIITQTQPGNAEAYDILRDMGISSTFSETEAQNYYRKALKQSKGTSKRQKALLIAQDKNKSLLAGDPRKQDPVPWTRQAKLFMLLGDPKSALEILIELADRFPDDPYVQFHMGEVYYQNKKYFEAKEAFSSAWRIEQRIETADKLAACHVRLGQGPDAVKWYNIGIQFNTRDPWIVNGLGWLHYKQNNNPTALTKWMDSLLLYEQSLNEIEEDGRLEPRWEDRALSTARAILRVGSTFDNFNLTDQNFGTHSLRLIATAASSLVWDDKHMVEIVWSILNKIDEPDRMTLSKFVQAIRAHFIYRLLVCGAESAWNWHSQWFTIISNFSDKALVGEYLGGAKSTYSRAAMWAASHLITGNHINKPESKAKIEPHWNELINIACKWGYVDGYYSKLREALPYTESVEESYHVASLISSNLLQISFQKAGIQALTEDLSVCNSTSLEKSLIAAGKIQEFNKEVVSLKTIFPDYELTKTDTPQELVYVDLLSTDVLINAASQFVCDGTGSVQARWFRESNQDDYISLGFRDGRNITEKMAESIFRPFAEQQLQNRISVKENEIQLGLPLLKLGAPSIVL